MTGTRNPVFRWIVTLLWVWPLHGQSRDQIKWYMPDFPPGHIKDGPYRDKGYLDLMVTKIIFPYLSDYDHVEVLSAPGRSQFDVVRFPNVCIPAVAKSAEREKIMLFSMPIFQFLPAGLVIRKSDLPDVKPMIDSKGRISLSIYLTRRNHKLGVVGKRVYGEQVDDLLHSSASQVEAINATSSTISLPLRVALRRGLDATLAYDFELPYESIMNPALKDAWAWLPVVEEPDSMLSYIACSKSETGQTVINKINKLLRNADNAKRLQSFYESWLDEVSRKRIQTIRGEKPATG